MTGWLQRFGVRGVFWRQLLRFGTSNCPIWVEPVIMAFWSAFFLLWGPGRRNVMRNLRAMNPRSSAFANFFRAYRVFWNYAWSIADTQRFRDDGMMPDWEFSGGDHIDELHSGTTGAIILTAHMGSYDIGAHVLSEMSGRRVVMVRAPEVDPTTGQFEAAQHERTRSEGLRIDFNTKASELALELLHAVREGAVVAIQGDRVTPSIASLPGTLFGKPVKMPAGPFALALAARVPIFPLFIVRAGRRKYRLVSFAPIRVERQSGRRDESLRVAIDAWTAALEQVVRSGWHQWFAFDPHAEDAAA